MIVQYEFGDDLYCSGYVLSDKNKLLSGVGLLSDKAFSKRRFR